MAKIRPRTLLQCVERDISIGWHLFIAIMAGQITQERIFQIILKWLLTHEGARKPPPRGALTLGFRYFNLLAFQKDCQPRDDRANYILDEWLAICACERPRISRFFRGSCKWDAPRKIRHSCVFTQT